MISEPLQISEDHPAHPTQERGPVVTDADGYVIVLRSSNGKGLRKYHHVDAETFAAGDLVPRCGGSTYTGHGNKFLPKRRVEIQGSYRCCRWHQCGGDYTDSDRPETCHPEMAGLLDRLSVDQFDRLVAESQDREGGLG